MPFPSSVEFIFDWHLTNRCNFFCEYCHPQIRWVLNKKHLNEPLPAICARAFDSTDKVCGILMSGGEPFAFPQFVDLCSLLTRRHFIAINSNLSLTSEIEEFSRRIGPGKVSGILAGVHIAERESRGISLPDFARNYRVLDAAGFPITAAYVLHPSVLSRAPKDFEELKSHGVRNVAGKVFKGVWEGRRFPFEYSESERAMLSELIADYRVGRAYLDRDWDFRGLPCWSGVRSFKIAVTGEVQRCVSVPGSLGNIYDGSFAPFESPSPCTARHVKVLSECADQLMEMPTELAALIP